MVGKHLVLTPSLLGRMDSLQVHGGREKYKNIPTAYRMIIKESGFWALYRGAIPRMVVVGPLFAITLLSFEALKSYMLRNNLL